MAKFKVGDIVKILAGSKAGKVGRVESSAPGPQGGEMYHIRLDEGILTDAAERNITLANSRACNGVRSMNAVVAKALHSCGTARNAGDRDMYEDAIRQAIVKCEAAIKYEPDADDYSDVTRLVKQAKDLLTKAYRAI